MQHNKIVFSKTDRGNSIPGLSRVAPVPTIIDTTLRDGEQAPGVVFSLNEKRRILKLLHHVGIEEVEVGTPSIGAAEQRDIATLLCDGAVYGMKLFCWCRGRHDDLEAAAAAGAERVHIGLPVSPLQMRAAGLTGSLVLRRLDTVLSEARSMFDHVSVGAQDATRADEAFLIEYVRCAFDAGAFRVRLADTVGVGVPSRIESLVRTIKHACPNVQIEFHGHNDYGLAAANALSAMSAGADAVSATVLGLGERAGNAALETLVLGALHLSELPVPYLPNELYPLCLAVAASSGRPISPSQPVVGDAVLRHESGIHVRGQLSNPRCFQPFLPAEVGRTEEDFLYSKMSGRAAALHLFRKAGLSPSEADIKVLLERISIASLEKKRSLQESEVLAMIYDKVD